MKSILFILLLGSFQPMLNAQFQLEKDFLPAIAPEVGTREWFRLNYANQHFQVGLKDGQLLITLASQRDTCTMDIPNGTLIGVDNGEFGGGLYFLPSDSTQPKKRIQPGNILNIFTWHNRVYYFDALAHGGFSSGELYLLNTEDPSFPITDTVFFEDAPVAFDIFNDQLYIAANSSFFVVKDRHKEQFFKDAFWSSLYPSSVAVKSEEEIYLGIRGGIVRINLLKKSFVFLRYKKLTSHF